MTIVVRRCDTWTEILNFLAEVKETYKYAFIINWKAEIYYIEEENDYKVRIKIDY